MQASVAGEIRWRLGIYDKVFELCRAGDFSYARFLALLPDQLRLARGAQGDTLEIPVGVPAGLTDRWTEWLSARTASEPAALPSRPDGLRRWLRLAQLHPELDPLALHHWMSAGAEPLLSSLAQVHEQGLAEVGRGQGGLQVAYLSHLALLSSLAKVLGAAAPGMAAVLAELLPLGWQEAGQRVGAAGGLPARLAYQMVLTTSLPALGVDHHQWQGLPANPRRTTAEALQMVSKIIAEPVETLPLARVVSTVSRRLLAEPRLRVALLKEQLAEQVRDAALLLLARSYEPGRTESVGPLLTITSSAQELVRAQYHHGRRQEVLTWLQAPARRAHRAAKALSALLQGAEQVAAGDSEPLGVHADLEGRAQLAAQGALLAGLDSYTQTLLEDVTRLMVWVPAEQVQSEYSAGRAYRLADEASPIHLLAPQERQAALHIDLPRVPAARLDRDLLTPFMRRVRAEPALIEAALGMHHVAVLGPITEVLQLSQYTLGLIEAWAADARAPVKPVLGGENEQNRLRKAEIRRLDQRIREVEAALRSTETQPSAKVLLKDSHALLLEQRELLTDVLARRMHGARPASAQVCLGVSYGEVAQGGDTVWVSQTLAEAAAIAEATKHAEPEGEASDAICLVAPRALAAYETARVGLSASTSTDRPGWVRREVFTRDGRALLTLERKVPCGEDESWQLLGPGPGAVA